MDIFSTNRLAAYQNKVSFVPEDFVLSDTTYFEHKEDGRRLTIYKNGDHNTIAIYRKNINVWPDISKNKNIALAIQNIPDGTILDGEAMPAEGNKLASDVIRDIKAGRANYRLFSIPRYRGEDIFLNGPMLRKELERINCNLVCPTIKTLAGMLADELEGYESSKLKDLSTFKGVSLLSLKGYLIRYIRSQGIEGLIVRDYHKDFAYKYKEPRTATCVVTRKVRGDINGKYFLTLGSLMVSMFDSKGRLVPVGKCGGFSQLQRDEIWEMDISQMPPVEVEYDSLTKNRRLRFAQFKGFREDRSKESCLLSSLRE